jgi:hypothetical protein
MRERTGLIFTAIVVLPLAAFFFDLHLPPGVIHGIPYVLLISISFWFPWRAAPVALASVSTGPTSCSWTCACR